MKILDCVLYLFQYDASIDFDIKYPIQEKYLSCIYLLILRISESNLDLSKLPISTKIQLFTYMFSGLSSGFQILKTLSLEVMRNLAVHYQVEGCSSHNQICA